MRAVTLRAAQTTDPDARPGEEGTA
jgi:hypothetical protein